MIARRRNDEPDLPRGKSSDVKPKMVEFDRNIGHKSVMSIRELFMDRYEPTHPLYQAINDMERIGDASAEGKKIMDQFLALDLSVDGSATL